MLKSLNTVSCEVMVDPARLGGDSDTEAKVTFTRFLREQFGWKSVIDLGDISTARGTERARLQREAREEVNPGGRVGTSSANDLVDDAQLTRLAWRGLART